MKTWTLKADQALRVDRKGQLMPAVLAALGFLGVISIPTQALTLTEYLEQVKTKNPTARATIHLTEANKLRLEQPASDYSPELYSEYRLFDNREQPSNPLMGIETRGNHWRVGVRDQTTYGLNADVYAQTDRTNILGVSPQFFAHPDYEQSAIGVQLTQSLWRNGLGQFSKADYEGKKAAARIEVLRSQYQLKNILLNAENTYWSLVSFNEIIKLQTDNVERARKLRDHMRGRADLRLYDDVDAMQTEYSFEQRDFELQSSINDRAALIRQFNTLRGNSTETQDSLEELPTGEMMLKTAKDPAKHMSREDFRIIAEQALMSETMAMGAESLLKPKLDLVGGISSHGLNPDTAPAMQAAEKGEHPDWSVGVVFSVPLDYRLIGDLARSYRAQASASKDMKEEARFEEDRAWDDSIKKNREAQTLFEKSMTLEKLMTELVKRERARLLNGRSTTLQTVTIEQNLADAQIRRVRSQLSLLQIHNVLKQFEEQP